MPSRILTRLARQSDNPDPHDKPGTYWVATYFISVWESEFFFDSYGFSADTYGIDGYINQNVTRYNDKPFQGLTSDTCTQLCKKIVDEY